MLLAICAVIFLLLLQVSSIAAALSGGTAVSTMGAIGWAYHKIRGASSQACGSHLDVLSPNGVGVADKQP